MNKILLFAIVITIFTMQASALSFSNFSATSTSVGSVNTGNGYFDNDASQFGYSDSRNVYIVAEATEAWIFEPISYSAGGSAVKVVNSSAGTITDAIVHNGYVYFIDGGVLKKKKSRSVTNYCESNDTTAGGCVSIIVSSNVGKSLKVHNNVLYYTSSTNLKHLDSGDNAVSDFALPTIPGGETQFSSFGVTTNGTDIQAYVVSFSGVSDFLYTCTSGGCTAINPSISSNSVSWSTYFETTNYMYVLDYQVIGGTPNTESLRRITNSSSVTVDYAVTNTLALRNRAYVGGFSTVGLITQTTTSYETFNSNEAGESSVPLSEGSGIVQYANKEVSVPNPTYYNDSVIPMNVNLKFIISDANHTNYSSSAFWHLHAFNPTGIEVEDHDLPILCTQTQPWWDPFGVLSLFLIDLTTPWACDGTQTVLYSRTPNTFWMNGTWTVELTEQIPGTTSILSTDTWNIVNASSNGTGSITQTPNTGGGIGGSTATITTMLSSLQFWSLLFIIGIMLAVAYKERGN